MIIRPQNSITRNTVILTKTAPDTTDTGIEDVLYLFGKTFYKWENNKWESIIELPDTLDVINTLDSTSTAAALSANMGRALREMIEGINIPAIPEFIKLANNRDEAQMLSDSDKDDAYPALWVYDR